MPLPAILQRQIQLWTSRTTDSVTVWHNPCLDKHIRIFCMFCLVRHPDQRLQSVSWCRSTGEHNGAQWGGLLHRIFSHPSLWFCVKDRRPIFPSAWPMGTSHHLYLIWITPVVLSVCWPRQEKTFLVPSDMVNRGRQNKKLCGLYRPHMGADICSHSVSVLLHCCQSWTMQYFFSVFLPINCTAPQAAWNGFHQILPRACLKSRVVPTFCLTALHRSSAAEALSTPTVRVRTFGPSI